jgi:ribosomal protein S27E
MSTVVTARNASADPGAFHYQRHRPEKTLLYQLVSRHYPVFRQQLAEDGRILPDYVQREFEDYLKCGRLEYGFLRVRCETCHEERLVAFSCKRRGLLRASCPSPFGPACGGSKSPPAILSAPVAARAAWPKAQPFW